MKRRKKRRKKAGKPLDKVSGKQPRGRKRRVNPRLVADIAEDYELSFTQRWEHFRRAFMDSNTEEEFERDLEIAYSEPRTKFPPDLFPVVLSVRKDPKFPKTEKARIKFFADSLAAYGKVSPRRSREIIANERKRSPRHVIISQDFYIECSCGYEGPAKRGKCRRCGTHEVSLMARAHDYFD